MIVTIRYKASGKYRVIETDDFNCQSDVDFHFVANYAFSINSTEYRPSERMIFAGKTKCIFNAPTVYFTANDFERVYEEF